MKKKQLTAVTVAGVLLFCIGTIGVAAAAVMCLPGSARADKTVQKTNITKEQQEFAEEALKKVKKAESMQADLTLDLGIEVFGIGLDARGTIDMVAFRKPHLMKSQVRLDLGLLGEAERQIYIRESKKGYEVYAYSANGWDYGTIKTPSVRKFDALEMMQTYMEQITAWEFAGEKELSSCRTYLYRGSITGDGLKEILMNTESLDVVQELLKETLLNPFAAALEQTEKLQTMMEASKDLQVSLWIDAATGYPVRCEMDITKMLRDAYSELLGSLQEKQPGRAGMKLLKAIEVADARITIDCSHYNKAEPIMLPKAALEARQK